MPGHLTRSSLDPSGDCRGGPRLAAEGVAASGVDDGIRTGGLRHRRIPCRDPLGEQGAGRHGLQGRLRFHPILCLTDQTGEALAAFLRPRNSGANTVGEHVSVLDDAIAQPPAGIATGDHDGDGYDPGRVSREVVMRADSAECTPSPRLETVSTLDMVLKWIRTTMAYA
jgi:hypothetical protein